jgi:hypothetical protein
MCWGIGAFLAAGILRGTLNLGGDAAWKVPYALQWLWPVPLFIIAWMAPESKFLVSAMSNTLTHLQVHSTLSVKIESTKPGTLFASSLVQVIERKE